MSKQRIDEYLPFAYEALQKCGIAENNEIDKTFRSHISTFGAAVTMGSLLAAIAFFSKQGGAIAERQKLMKAIHFILLKKDGKDVSDCNYNSLFMLVKDADQEQRDYLKEEIIDAAISIKLAMNIYDLKKAKRKQGDNNA